MNEFRLSEESSRQIENFFNEEFGGELVETYETILRAYNELELLKDADDTLRTSNITSVFYYFKQLIWGII